MTEKKMQIRICALAFALLFLVSLYRQISLRVWPDDPLRTYILYACYLILTVGWAWSLHNRITTKSMRLFLIADATVMLFGLTIRFLQDTYWENDVFLMRQSGLMILATILPMLTLGFFASLGAGKPDSFRVPRGWYLLLLPVAMATALIAMDERFHWMFYLDPGESQPNLNFHPYVGTFLVMLFSFAIVILRVLLIDRRNKAFSQTRLPRVLIPLFEPLLAVLFTLEYFVVSLDLIPALQGMEVIELYAKIYAVEVLTWEFYIYIGLVPVNVEYREIFEHARLGLQVVGNDGLRLQSQRAAAVTADQLRLLREQPVLRSGETLELHAHALPDGLVVWSKDVSELWRAIEQLNEQAEELNQEGILLEEEWKAKQQEAALAARNRIYDDLAREVGRQLEMLKAIPAVSVREDRERCLSRLALLGTYIKRRCNLRLIQWDTGTIPAEDLLLSLQDQFDVMRKCGVGSELQWDAGTRHSPGFSLLVFDTLECLLESADLKPEACRVWTRDERVCMEVIGQPLTPPVLPDAPVGCVARAEPVSGGYAVTLWEGAVQC